MPTARRSRSENRARVTDSDDDMDQGHQRSAKAARKTQTVDAATVHFFDHDQDVSSLFSLLCFCLSIAVS